MDVMGVDCYNLCGTGSIGRTLATSSGGLNEHIPVVCCEVQMDEKLIVLNDQGGSVMDVSNEVTATLRAQDHGHPPVVCMAYDGYNMSVNDKTFMTITSGATDDHHIPSVIYSLEGNGARPSHQGTGYSDEGKMFTLNTIEKHAVCYAIEGNVVDRISAKNGKGWCEDVSPTLNTQDKHAVCFPVESIGHDIRSTQFSRGGCCDTMTASDYKDPIIVCYDARGNGGGWVTPTITGDHQNRVTDYTAVVALALGATDANASITDGTVSPCILARACTGGQRADNP